MDPLRKRVWFVMRGILSMVEFALILGVIYVIIFFIQKGIALIKRKKKETQSFIKDECVPVTESIPAKNKDDQGAPQILIEYCPGCGEKLPQNVMVCPHCDYHLTLEDFERCARMMYEQ